MKSFLEYNGQELVEETEPETMVLPVRIGRSDYLLEVADTPETIQRGLSGRQSIPRKTGMLFVMPVQSIQEFWMKGCETDMDILFVNEDGMIVHMERMLRERKQTSTESDELYESRLRSYSSKYPVKYAIEIPSGDITRLGLQLGEMLNIPENIKEQVIPISVSTNVNRAVATAYPETTRRAAGPNSTLVDRVQVYDEIEKEKAAPKVREKLEIDALKRMVGTPEYAAASDAERTKMLDRALESIGDDPSAISDQFTTKAERDAAFSFASEVRRQNIQKDVESRRQNLSDEEKQLSTDELRRRGLIGSRYTKTTDTATKREPGSTTSSLDDLFAAQDDLAQLKRDIRDRARERRRRHDGIMRIAQSDLRILDANKDIKPGDVMSGRVSLGQVGDAIRDAGGYTRGERQSVLRSAGRNNQGFRVSGLREQAIPGPDHPRHTHTARVSAENANASNRTPGEIQALMHKIRDTISGVASKYLKGDEEPYVHKSAPKATTISPEMLKSKLIAQQALKFDPRGEAQTDYTGGARIRPKETPFYTKFKQKRRSEAQERVRAAVMNRVDFDLRVRDRVRKEIEGEQILRAIGKRSSGRDYDITGVEHMYGDTEMPRSTKQIDNTKRGEKSYDV